MVSNSGLLNRINVLFRRVGRLLTSTVLTGTPTAPTAADGTNTTQIATTAFVQAALAYVNVARIKGVIDASANPNYPAADSGDIYVISVAGKVGGASGKTVEVGDMALCIVDGSLAGTEAQRGTNWIAAQVNIVGALLSASNLSDLASAATARTNLGLGSAAVTDIEDVVTQTITDGVLESAPSEDAVFGAFATQQVALDAAKIQSIIVAASDETTALTAGTAKVTFRMPYAFTVTAVRASLTTAQPSGSIFTVDIKEGGVSILSTLLTIDNTEKTSTTAAAPPVVSDASLADDAEITVDISQVGDAGAAGLKVAFVGTRT